MSKKKTKQFVIRVYCQNCSTLLYIYRKEGPGLLVKYYVDGILKDYTKGNLKCPQCGRQFAKLAKYHNRPAHKIVQGKVFVKGYSGR